MLFKESLSFTIQCKNHFPFPLPLTCPSVYYLFNSFCLLNPLIFLLYHVKQILLIICWWDSWLFCFPVLGYIDSGHENFILFTGYSFRYRHVLYSLIFCLLLTFELWFCHLTTFVLTFVYSWGFVYSFMLFFKHWGHGGDVLLLLGNSGDGAVVLGEGGNRSHPLLQDGVEIFLCVFHLTIIYNLKWG